MAKKFPIKAVMLCIVILFILSLGATFSISYAGWVSNNSEFSANVNVGYYSDKEMVDLVKEVLKPTNEKPECGGIFVNNDPDQIYGSIWANQKTANGFSVTLDLKEGDTFVAVIYERTWEKDKRINEGFFSYGTCKIENSNSESDYAIKLSEDKKTFIVVKACKVTITVKENGNRKQNDMLTISGTVVEDGSEVTVNYPAS